MTPETHRILPWLSPHVSQGQRHCSTSGLKQQKIMTLVVRTRDAKNSSLYHPSIIFEYLPKTPSTIQVLSEISPNTRMILEYSRYPNEYLAPKTNRVHISNEDCNDISNEWCSCHWCLWWWKSRCFAVRLLVLPEKECHNHSGEWGLSSLY